MYEIVGKIRTVPHMKPLPLIRCEVVGPRSQPVWAGVEGGGNSERKVGKKGQCDI